MHSLQVYFIVCYFDNFFTFYKFHLFTHLFIYTCIFYSCFDTCSIFYKHCIVFIFKHIENFLLYLGKILPFSFHNLCLQNKLDYLYTNCYCLVFTQCGLIVEGIKYNFRSTSTVGLTRGSVG